MLFKPHDYQFFGISWLIQKTIIDNKPGAGFFLDPGLGKTSMTLAWIRLLKMLGLSRKVLIIAPLRVIYSVWPAECQQWDQFKHLRCSIVHGDQNKRMKQLAVDADIYLINPEGVSWLRTYYALRPWPFDTLVIDESTKFKGWSNVCTKALKKVLPKFRRKLILTGTPAPHSLIDLFSQIYILDEGKALGTGVSQFRNRWFYRGGFGGYSWVPMQGAADQIEKKIAGLVLRMDAKDHLDMPEMLTNDVWCELPPKFQKEYRKLERDMWIEFEGVEDPHVLKNVIAKYGACKQYAGGGMYDGEKNQQVIHHIKIDAIKEIVEELQGKPVLIAFQYRHEHERLKKAFPGMKSIQGGVSATETDRLVEDWNAGKIRILAVQPKALSHGINMQKGPGRDIVWFGVPDNMDDYIQFNARVWRQGVDSAVRIHRILMKKTVDVACLDRLLNKQNTQTGLLESLKKYRGQDAE